MRDLAIGVIGTGKMGADHAETISSVVAGAFVRAVADIDRKRAESVASRLSGARSIVSVEELIQSPDINAIIIASNSDAHSEQVLASVAAGKPVLCEKPLAPTVAECEKILRAEQAVGQRLLQVGFMRRFDPAYAELQQQLASGSIGSPLLAHCAHRNFGVPCRWTAVDTIVSSAVHEFDVMPWLFGREVVGVNWYSSIPFASGSLPDPQVIVLELAGGPLVVLEVTMNSYGYEIRCEIVGDKGTIELAVNARTVRRTRLQVSEVLPEDFRMRFADAYRIELQSWVNAIQRWRSDPSDGEPISGADAWDGYRAAVITEAVVASMNNGQKTAVNYLPLPDLYRPSRTSS
jgi:myo-inositol 2-dehydrogenase/D-chiro-inositol 1-dehydrogenase